MHMYTYIYIYIFPYFSMVIPMSMKHRSDLPGTCLGPRDASHVGALAMPTCWLSEWLVHVNGY